MTLIQWATVITSAAIGAVVSSAITFVGQFFDRRQRKSELLLSKAVEISRARHDRIVSNAEKAGIKVTMPDEILSVDSYYRWMKHLMEHGELPNDPKIERPNESDDQSQTR